MLDNYRLGIIYHKHHWVELFRYIYPLENLLTEEKWFL
jgi:hypothetical protein